MAIENSKMYEAAQVELDRLGYAPDDSDRQNEFYQTTATNLQPQFPTVAPARLRHQVNRVMMRRRGEAWRKQPGAPAGNTNAARKDGQPRQALNVRVEQTTLDWLQSQANQTTGGNVGRWLDALAYSHS